MNLRMYLKESENLVNKLTTTSKVTNTINNTIKSDHSPMNNNNNISPLSEASISSSSSNNNYNSIFTNDDKDKLLMRLKSLHGIIDRIDGLINPNNCHKCNNNILPHCEDYECNNKYSDSSTNNGTTTTSEESDVDVESDVESDEDILTSLPPLTSASSTPIASSKKSNNCKSKLFIPILDLSKTKNEQSYQDEFLATKDMWSESWREDANEMLTNKE